MPKASFYFPSIYPEKNKYHYYYQQRSSHVQGALTTIKNRNLIWKSNKNNNYHIKIDNGSCGKVLRVDWTEVYTMIVKQDC